MRKYFFTGDNLKYKLTEDCPYFETVDPFAEIGDSISHRDRNYNYLYISFNWNY